MATAALTVLMDEMAAVLEAELSSVDQVVARLNLNPSGLSVDIYPAPTFRDPEAGGFGQVTGAYVFTVRARLDIGDLDASQDALLALMDDEGSDSLAVALFDDQTLNGYASSVKIDGPTGFQPYTDSVDGAVKVGCEWTVTVLRATS